MVTDFHNFRIILISNKRRLRLSYKKLSYCRDSARGIHKPQWPQWLLRCPRSFKVTDIPTNRKLVCDFLLVN